MSVLELTPAELSLVEAVGRGVVWSPDWFREWKRRHADPVPPTMFDSGGRSPHEPTEGPEPDADGGGGGGNDDGGGDDSRPAIRAELIRDLVLGKVPEADRPDWFDDRGVRLKGAKIAGPLDLEVVDYDLPIEIEDSEFDSEIILKDARLRRVSFKGGDPRFIDGEGCRIDRDLDLSAVETDWIGLLNADIGGILNLTEAELNPAGEDLPVAAIDCGGAQIGHVFLRGCNACGQVTFIQSRISGVLA
ncbi:MAG: hypothetical protein ACLFWF_04595, partial [Alphaproteobacteria bacterium]